ncbi:NADPH:quinone reductase-like Zn-dependent oxidoreductase [Mesorhizobium sangaii]|uniref:NADPH:quinone reductase-like Zn-dependent oxidoreductase n=1 Tax=Mesorhizobium sangaii TaxID=505389 RepID=A0A841PYT4_9HYPH|nr:NADPH:quinone reductase-like Zn-dependent oxidoreductase [Mesorhizobium sangaii]
MLDAELFRQGQPHRIDVGDDHLSRTDTLRHQRAHDADRPGAGDQHVFADQGHIVCGHCRSCRAGRGHLCRNTLGVGVNRPGAFGEYLAIPQHNVVPIPDDVPDEIAAIFDPLGNAVHTALSFDLA